MEYNWIWSGSDVKIKEGELNKVITAIHWRRILTDGEYFAENIGVQAIGEPNPDAFTDYENLSHEEVFAWLEASMNVEVLDAQLAENIELQKNPITATIPPPSEG